jgi:hypothetical protein
LTTLRLKQVSYEAPLFISDGVLEQEESKIAEQGFDVRTRRMSRRNENCTVMTRHRNGFVGGE